VTLGALLSLLVPNIPADHHPGQPPADGPPAAGAAASEAAEGVDPDDQG
jgi:hypothetical protein